MPMLAALGAPAEPSSDRSGKRYAWGRLLWLHPVFILSAPADSKSAQVDAIAQPFKSDFHRNVDLSSGLFVPGIEMSVIVSRGGPRARETFLWQISLNWAYYALFMEIDRGLLATLDDEKWQTSASLG